MCDVINRNNGSRHTFRFHGEGLKYFGICLVNFLLSIVTLGIFVPWAMVRSRRYIYQNMELNGVRFDYHASGGALLASWLLFFVLYSIIIVVMRLIHPAFGSLALLLLMLVMPFLMVKSLQYNAMMTTLNNVRFAFNCSMKSAWWVMMGLPLVLLLALFLVVFVLAQIMFRDYDLNGMIVKGALLALIFFVGINLINGYVYAKWIALTGKSGQFGIHKFNITVSAEKCIVICLLSLCILIPFIALMVFLGMGIYSNLLMARYLGAADALEMLNSLYAQIAVFYSVYLLAILVSSSYIWQALRNHFMNNLTLADERIRFHSTLSFHGVVLQVLLLVVVSMITLGLAYPWMKIRFLRFLAVNSHVDGDLDSIELTDHDQQVDKGFIAVVSRGLMPVVPFI
ncbi:YjgN family protein [Phytobacter massiliensis]|uniref:YjgN family protein n=1 Tax=Phytobacter massiliensis TaxID=1485952 RepID=UPI0002D4DE06|nr:DUF898 family protein [Phytobacter massiliensis]